MAKLFFSILFLSMISNGIGQEKLISEQFLISDSLSKVNYLDQVFRMTEHLYCNGYKGNDEIKEFKNFIESYYNDFFLIKNQKDTVLIFDGKRCPGFESGEVIAYKIKDGRVNYHFSKSGKIAYLGYKYVTIHTYPCCAMITNIITKFDIETGKPIDNSHVFFSYSDFLVIEKYRRNSNLLKKIELIESTEVRWSDTIESTIYPIPPSACTNGNTNTISLIGTLSQVHLLSYNEEKTWALVRFKNVDANETYCPINTEKELIDTETYYIYGWIKVDSFIKK